MPKQNAARESGSSGAKRAALYIRVSTEEQAMHGYSLAAQKETLTRYAEAHGLTIVGCYVDEGRSARKKFQNRRGFMQMLADVEADRIDLILFIKLDRWFRSVKDYYKIQEILEAHHVDWKTTEEHYDTTTTNGRLYINIRLSVAQDESDRDSDRIKFVFRAKAARGETLVGAQSLPLGLTVREKRVVPDPETAVVARALFAHYALHRSNSAARQYALDTYGVRISHQSLTKMLSNRLYIGEYRGNPHYCEPLVDTALFRRIQEALPSGVRKTPANRTYLFSGLTVCAECGRKMAGRYTRRGEREYYHYRCNYAANLHACWHRKTISEPEMEALLVERVGAEADRYAVEYRARTAKREASRQNPARLRQKLAKLKELYVNGLIGLEEYRADRDAYTAQLTALCEPAAQAVEPAGSLDFLRGDFQAIYAALDRESRRALWRSVLLEIRVDSRNFVTVVFA